MIGTLANLATTVTAVVGLFVAALAFRGYRQNDSVAMLALSVGIVAIAVVPFLVTELAGPLLALTDAQALVAILLSHTLGLAAIYRSFRN
jgi:chromate transport protein ChrA